MYLYIVRAMYGMYENKTISGGEYDFFFLLFFTSGKNTVIKMVNITRLFVEKKRDRVRNNNIRGRRRELSMDN